jgi:hypothetical protein
MQKWQQAIFLLIDPISLNPLNSEFLLQGRRGFLLLILHQVQLLFGFAFFCVSIDDK